MTNNPFSDVLNWGEEGGTALRSAIGNAAIAQPIANEVKALESNIAPLAVGLGLFVLGALMIAFSVFEDIANLAEKALGIASDPVGAAVGNKPLLSGVLTKILP